MHWDRRTFVKVSSGALAGLTLSGCRGESGSADGEEIVLFRNGIVLPVDAGFSEQRAIAFEALPQ